MDKVFTIGASRGGYGAILIGTLINADEVFAFSPKTFMEPGLDRKYKISNNLRELKKKIPEFSYDINFFDLKDIILKNRTKTKYNIFYGSLNPHDHVDAEKISDLEYVKIYTTNSFKHGIAGKFIKNGELKKLLKEALKWKFLF